MRKYIERKIREVVESMDRRKMIGTNMSYRVIDKANYYRKDVFRHFSEDCKCSTSMTARIDVTELVQCSKEDSVK